MTKLDWIIHFKLWLEDIESGKKTTEDVRLELAKLLSTDVETW